jgi:hypothetical protein
MCKYYSNEFRLQKVNGNPVFQSLNRLVGYCILLLICISKYKGSEEAKKVTSCSLFMKSRIYEMFNRVIVSHIVYFRTLYSVELLQPVLMSTFYSTGLYEHNIPLFMPLLMFPVVDFQIVYCFFIMFFYPNIV